MKYIKILSILLCVFCLTGCQETENTDKIEETAPQETNVGQSESQEDMQSNKEETNSDENDSIEKINKYMIPEQSFDVFLDDWGEVTFVSRKPAPGEFGDHKTASFYLMKDERILYKFPYRFENNSLIGYVTGIFDSVGAVAFRDINNDKKNDIIIITYYNSGAGPTGMVPRPMVTIYLAGENEFYLAEDMIIDVDENITGQDRTIANINRFLIDKKSENDMLDTNEEWKDAYRDIIYNIDKKLADPYGVRNSNGPTEYYYIGTHDFDDNDMPELIIGDGISVAIFTYENNTSKKVADVYGPEARGCINGLYFKDNQLLLVNAGSDGCGYVAFTYDKGEYLTGIYDDYSPEVATINEKQISGEEFKQQFDLTELRENGSITYIKIERENKGTLIIKDEEMVIDDLDFTILQW